MILTNQNNEDAVRSLPKAFLNLNRHGDMMDVIGSDFPLELMQSNHRTALITLAMLFSNNLPQCVHVYGLAASQLAMFAAQPHGVLPKSDYDRLRFDVDQYRNYFVEADAGEPEKGYDRMAHFLSFILDEAEKAACQLACI